MSNAKIMLNHDFKCAPFLFYTGDKITPLSGNFVIVRSQHLHNLKTNWSPFLVTLCL
jgi:hypothetical protein